MRILILEHLCVLADDASEGTLAEEGFAMVRAASRDLADLGIDVRVAVHSRWKSRAEAAGIPVLVAPVELEQMALLGAAFDRVVLIAPEIDGIAARWARRFEDSGARLLGPTSIFVAWASDKLTVAQTLADCSPPTMIWSDHPAPADWGDEFIIKPRDGVGAIFTLVVPRDMLPAAAHRIRAEGFKGDLILQPYVPGRSISVAVVSNGPGKTIRLPPVEQIIDAASEPTLIGARRLKYCGGFLPVMEVADRVEVVAGSAMESMPPWKGWIGMDVVLGDDGRDVVVDVNPRLTTSYLGYSALFPGIAGRLLVGRETNGDLIALRQPPRRRVRFDVSGNVASVVESSSDMW